MNKKEKKEKLVKLNVMSTEGDSKYSLIPSEALEQIRNFTENEGKWLYLDGEFKNSEIITESDLVKAEHILLTNIIAGGGVQDAFNVMSKITDKIDSAIIMNLDTDKRNIKIDINSTFIKSLSLHGTELSQELLAILDKEAVEGYNTVALAYGRKSKSSTKIVKSSTHSFDGLKNDIEIEIDLNKNLVHFHINNNNKFKIINLRNWYGEVLGRKINDFVDEELKNASEVYNV